MEDEKALEVSRQKLLSKYLGEDLAREITSKTPKEIISERPIRGGGRAKYVAGPHFIRKLNECFGFFWSFEVPEYTVQDGQIVGKGRLTVHLPVPGRKVTRRYLNENGKEVVEESVDLVWRDIVKEQFGSSEVKTYAQNEYITDKRGNKIQDSKGQPLLRHKAGDVIDLGDDHKAMSTDAKKKCATELGIFLDVYETRASREEGGGVTEQQLRVFYMRAEKAGMDKKQAEEWGVKEVRKPISDWEELDCMGLIPKLMDLAKEKE